MKHLQYRSDMKHFAYASYNEKNEKMRVFLFVIRFCPHYIIQRKGKLSWKKLQTNLLIYPLHLRLKS